MSKKVTSRLLDFMVGLLFFICILPFMVVILAGFRDAAGNFSFMGVYDVLFRSPAVLSRYFKSILISLTIASGQTIVSAFAGYGLARYRFHGRSMMQFLILLLLLLPVQVTLIPGYIMLNNLSLIGSVWSLILPQIFLPLGTFLLSMSFSRIPQDVLGAAMLDGCGELNLFLHIGIPSCRNTLVTVFILSFLDSFQMVEQPIAYLNSFDQYPISVAIAFLSKEKIQIQGICCILILLPCLYLFLTRHEELTKGIETSEE